MHRLSVQHSCSFIATQLHVSVHVRDHHQVVKQKLLKKVNMDTEYYTLRLSLWDVINYEKAVNILTNFS
jgi:hypothetical protein